MIATASVFAGPLSSAAPSTHPLQPTSATPSTGPGSRTGGLPPPRQNPWRRQGTTLLAEAAGDPGLALRAAGLAWAVERVDLRTADTLDPVPASAAIRRADTNAILGVVGADYEPFQNEQLIHLLGDLATAGAEQGQPVSIETAGSFQGGRVVWALAHLPGLGIRLGEDASRTYLLVANGHVGNKQVTIAPTTVRVVCQNTLRLAEVQARANRRRLGLAGGFQVRHTPGLHGALRELREAFAATLRSHQASREAWLHLARRPLTQRLEREVLAAVFGVAGPDEAERARALRTAREERIAAILASPTGQVRGTRDSAFSLLQAIVEYVDHDRTTRTGEGGDAGESRLFSAAFGSGADLKARAWEAVMANAA